MYAADVCIEPRRLLKGCSCAPVEQLVELEQGLELGAHRLPMTRGLVGVVFKGQFIVQRLGEDFSLGVEFYEAVAQSLP